MTFTDEEKEEIRSWSQGYLASYSLLIKHRDTCLETLKEIQDEVEGLRPLIKPLLPIVMDKDIDSEGILAVVSTCNFMRDKLSKDDDRRAEEALIRCQKVLDIIERASERELHEA